MSSNNFVTTGPDHITFWTYSETNIDGYNGKFKKHSLGHFSGNLVNTIYVGNTGNAVSFTDEGYIILWEKGGVLDLSNKDHSKSMYNASKVVRLSDSGIYLMYTINSYIVAATKDGYVRFYDFTLRLEAWFEDLAAGPITSLSFSLQEPPNNIPSTQFWVPDFVVGTQDALVVGVESAIFQEIRAEDRRGTLLLQGMTDEIMSMCCHPKRPLLAIICFGGNLQIWDYELKLLLNLRELNLKNSKTKLQPSIIAFDLQGKYLILGTKCGTIKVLNVNTLEDIMTLSPSTEAISKIVFSPCSSYFIIADKSGRIMIYKTEENFDALMPPQSAQPKFPYTLLGRATCHNGLVIGLDFGFREGSMVLISVGEDRKCLEYDLKRSSVHAGILLVEKPSKIEFYSTPKAVAWHPKIGEDTEDKFIVANDEYKFKEYNSESKQCRKTTMYPSYGGVIDKMIVIGQNDPELCPFLAFSASEKIVGLAKLPLTGNPDKMMGIVAHPGVISGITCSNDSKYLFTSGGTDLSINMWQIDFSIFEDVETYQSDIEVEMAAFYTLLEGGAGGELHNDIIDYFYYCQIRSQGENSMEPRKIIGAIDLDQIPYLMRAVGYYPTEDEILNMINEIKYSNFMKTGIHRTDIKIEEFIKLYLNHRPVNPLNNLHIEFAFETLRKRLGISIHDSSQSINWLDIQNLLSSEGEVISTEDMESCLKTLAEGGSTKLKTLSFNPASFSDKILGFENN